MEKAETSPRKSGFIRKSIKYSAILAGVFGLGSVTGLFAMPLVQALAIGSVLGTVAAAGEHAIYNVFSKKSD